jgi:capsular exopolysaccharide synthesis family protein
VNEPQQQQEVHLRDYWQVIVKRRRIALIFFAVVVTVVTVYSLVATPVYQGTVQLLLDTERNQTLTFTEGGGAIIQSKDMAEYFNTLKTIMESRIFADRVVRKLQLTNNAYFKELKSRGEGGVMAQIRSLLPARGKQTPPVPERRLREELDPALTSLVLANSSLEVGKKSNIFTINFTATNPAVAAAMANGIADAFVEHNLDLKVKPYRDAAEWLSARLVESKAKVGESETKLQRYKEGTGVTSFETKESVLNQKLEELMTQQVQAEGKRQESEIKYRQIQSVIDRPDLLATVPDVMNNLVIQGLRTEELALRKQISELSEKYGEKHPQIIKAKSQLEMVRRNINLEARKMLNAAKSDFEVARSREASIRGEIGAQKSQVLGLTRKAIDYNVIAGEAGSNKQFYELLLKKLQEASLSSGMNVSNIQIVDSAVTPDGPVKPKRAKNILLALLVGLFGGISAAFFVEYMDDTVKSAEDVDKLLQLPLLDVVPLSDPGKGPLFILNDPKSTTAEAYRTIRTGIMLSNLDDQASLKTILVTSAVPNEGKSTTATNLAIAMAQMGERVLLVDMDLRRHNLHDLFAVENSVGISDTLIDPSRLSTAIREVPQAPNLFLMTGGSTAPNPSELLASERLKELVAGLRERFDRIILDSPPLMAFSDSLVLSRLADGVVMVAWGGKTPRGTIQHAVGALQGVNARVVGMVLNRLDISKHGGYGYYSYYYGYNRRPALEQA